MRSGRFEIARKQMCKKVRLLAAYAKPERIRIFAHFSYLYFYARY